MAMIDDQETLQIFLEDAREHLRGIEKDFLAIEAAGSAVDVALVPKEGPRCHIHGQRNPGG